MSDPILDAFAKRAAELAFDIKAYSESLKPPVEPPTPADPTRPEFRDKDAAYFSTVIMPQGPQTCIAVFDGNLEDPKIYLGGKAPTPIDDIEIPAGAKVTGKNINCRNLYVGGELTLLDGATLQAETVFEAPGGAINNAGAFEWTFKRGAIDPVADPRRKALCFWKAGSGKLVGEHKTTKRAIMEPVVAGQNFVIAGWALAEEDQTPKGEGDLAYNWQVGDALHVSCDWQNNGANQERREENVQIIAIEDVKDQATGKIFHKLILDRALKYDRTYDTTQGFVDFSTKRMRHTHKRWIYKSVVENLSRTGVFKCEDPDIEQHNKPYICVASPRGLLHYCELQGIGQTDRRRIDSGEKDDRGRAIWVDPTIEEEAITPETPVAQSIAWREPIVINTKTRIEAASVVGNSIWSGVLGDLQDSPGLGSRGAGIVIKMSRAIVVNNATVDTTLHGIIGATLYETGLLKSNSVHSVYRPPGSASVIWQKDAKPYSAGGAYLYPRGIVVSENLDTADPYISGSGSRLPSDNDGDGKSDAYTILYAFDPLDFEYRPYREVDDIHASFMAHYSIGSYGGIEVHKGAADADSTTLHSRVGRFVGWGVSRAVTNAYSANYVYDDIIAIACPRAKNTTGIELDDHSYGISIIEPILCGFTKPISSARARSTGGLNPTTNVLDINIVNPTIFNADGALSDYIGEIADFELTRTPHSIRDERGLIDETLEIVSVTNFDHSAYELHKTAFDIQIETILGQRSFYTGGEGRKHRNVPERSEGLYCAEYRGYIYFDEVLNRYWIDYELILPNTLGGKVSTMLMPMSFSKKDLDDWRKAGVEHPQKFPRWPDKPLPREHVINKSIDETLADFLAGKIHRTFNLAEHRFGIAQ